MQHGGIIDVESEEELDKMLAEDPDSLTVLLASLTWCRPCKTLAKPLQARPPLELPLMDQQLKGFMTLTR